MNNVYSLCSSLLTCFKLVGLIDACSEGVNNVYSRKEKENSDLTRSSEKRKKFYLGFFLQSFFDIYLSHSMPPMLQ